MVRASFDIGEPVVDCKSKDDDPNTAIIVNCPPQAANEWNAYRNTTVAEDNPDYPEDAPVAVAVYQDELVAFDSDWADHDGPFSLSELNEAGVSHYSFPAPRLKSLECESEDENAQRNANTEPDEDIDNTEDTDDPSTDGSRTSPDSDSDGNGEINPQNEPPAAVRVLKDALEDRGMSAEIESDGHTITAEKLGVTYRVQPEKVLDGDGPHRDKIEQIVAEV